MLKDFDHFNPHNRCADYLCNNALPFLSGSRYCGPCLKYRQTQKEIERIAKEMERLAYWTHFAAYANRILFNLGMPQHTAKYYRRYFTG